MATPPDHLTCWQCGAPAVAHCASSVGLIATAKAGLTSLEYPVKRGRIHDRMTVNVPRCAPCQRRRRLEFGIVIGGLLLGGLVGQMVIPLAWPTLGVLPLPDLSSERRGSAAQAIGAVIGIAMALMVTTLHRRTRGIRSIYSYPAVVKAQAIGWKFNWDNG
jgi:hypothetical protein